MFASLFTLQKETLKYADQFFLVGTRMTLSGAVLLTFFLIKNKTVSIRAKDLKFFFMLAIFGIYLTNVLEIWGLNQMQSSRACLIYSLSPFASSILAYFLLNEVLSWKKFLAICIGFAGLFPIFDLKLSSFLRGGFFDWNSVFFCRNSR